LSNPVHVTIYGQQFTVVTDEDPARVENLAAQVDAIMRNIANRGIVDSNRAAVLTCLHLAEQVDTLQAELASLKKLPNQKQKLSDLLQLLDDELK